MTLTDGQFSMFSVTSTPDLSVVHPQVVELRLRVLLLHSMDPLQKVWLDSLGVMKLKFVDANKVFEVKFHSREADSLVSYKLGAADSYRRSTVMAGISPLISAAQDLFDSGVTEFDLRPR